MEQNLARPLGLCGKMSETTGTATEALRLYLAALHQTTEYLHGEGDVIAECRRVFAEVGREPWAKLEAEEPLVLGDRSADMAYGHGEWVVGDMRWHFRFLQTTDSWVDPDGKSWGVQHVIEPVNPPRLPRGSVWLGECNNSARYDTDFQGEALGLWLARRALTT